MESKKKEKEEESKLLQRVIIVLGILTVGLIMANLFLPQENKFIQVLNTLDGVTQPVHEEGHGTFIGDGGIRWSFDIQEDPKQEVAINITEINESVIELTLYEHWNSTTPQNYRWNMALCNQTGSGLQYENEDNQGGFEFATPINVNYGNLVNFGMNETWCGGGNGYALFSSGAKNQFPLKIRLLTGDITEFSLHAGTGSVEIDGSVTSVATQNTNTDNLCMTSDGILHVAYEGTANDVFYGNSTDDGLTWTTKILLVGSATDVGVLCHPDDTITVFYVETAGDDIDFHNSTDAGRTFSSASTAMDISNLLSDVAGAVDKNGVFHLCAIDLTADELFYVNSSNLNDEDIVNENNADDSDTCDIEVDTDGHPYIIAKGTDGDDLDIWSLASGGNGWGSANRIEIVADTGLGLGEGAVMKIKTIDDVEQVFIGYIAGDSDLWFYNASITNLEGFTGVEVDSTPSFNPSIGVNGGSIQILYMNEASESSSSDLVYANSTDGGITWDSNNGRPGGGINNMGFPSILDAHYSNSSNMQGTLRYVYYDTDLLYDNLTIPTPPAPAVLNLSILSPKTATVITVNNGTNITVQFNVTSDGIPQETGVTFDNITIDGIRAVVLGDPDGADNNTEFKSPSTTGEDHNQWSSASNAFSSDNSRATESSTGQQQDYFDFDLGFPAGDFTIDGIEVTVEAQEGISGTSVIEVELSHDGGTTYTSSSKQNSFTTTESVETYGGSTDTWGRTWAISEFSDTNFRLRVDAFSISVQVEMDHVQVKVYFHETGSQQFKHNGTSWVVNVTVPDRVVGTYDLFLNATFSSTSLNETQINSVTYEAAAADSCTYTSGNWDVDCSDNCSITSAVVGDTNSNLTIDGLGHFSIEAQISNFLYTKIGGQCTIKGGGNIKL